ncbi:hypothetical protein HGRIS_006590 [Hohenbuehelia grisea]|uniref:Rhodanese domain-containing protein n=1 Tax=Hohenbuehelia grisea TaxID=104357 RepID=A0ABR3J9P7_9AGAR
MTLTFGLALALPLFSSGAMPAKPPNLNIAGNGRANLGQPALPVLDDEQDAPEGPLLTLDSDDDDRGADSDESDIGPDADTDADELAKDLKALDQLRKSVQNNLRLRPIRSSQHLPKVDIFANHSPASTTIPLSNPASRSPWFPPDSSETSNTDTDTDASSRTTTTTTTNDSDEEPCLDFEPQSAVSTYFTPLSETQPSPFGRAFHPDAAGSPPATKDSDLGPSVPASALPSLLSASRVPLLIDTRSPPAHLAAHIPGSISLAIPSLILRRTRRTKLKPAQPVTNSSTGLPNLHALRQFITTDDSLAGWDSLIPSAESPDFEPNSKWNGSIIVYDDDMDPKSRDTPTAAAWALTHILPPLLAQALDDPSWSRAIPSETRGKVEYLEGGFAAAQQHPAMKPYFKRASASSTARDAPSTNSNGPAATKGSVKMGPPPRRSTTGMLGKKPSGLFQLDTLAALRSKQLPEVDLSSSATTSFVSSPSPTQETFTEEPESVEGASLAVPQRAATMASTPRSPLPVMSSVMSSASPISPFIPTTSPGSSSSTPSSMGSGIKLAIPANLIVDSSPSPPPSQSHPQLAFRRPIPPSSARRPSVPNLRRLDISASSSFTDAGVMSAHETGSGGEERRIPRLDIKSATATRPPRLNAKSAERLPKLSLRTTGIAPKGRAATLSVPPSAISGPYNQNANYSQTLSHYPLAGASKNAALRSPVDWGLLNAGFDKMSGQTKDRGGADASTAENTQSELEENGQVIERKEREEGAHLTPYFTPPHSPGTPKAPGFTLINGGPELPRTDRNGDELPPSPRTARPEESPPSTFLAPVSHHSISDSVLVYPPSSGAPYGRSPYKTSFGAPSPPQTSFGDSFHTGHGGYQFGDHGDGDGESDGQLTTEDPNPPFTLSTILPGFLFLGPEPATPDHLQMLKTAGVKRILNIAAECGKDDHGLGLGEQFEKYIKIPMRDHVEEEGVVSKVREVCEILGEQSHIFSYYQTLMTI